MKHLIGYNQARTVETFFNLLWVAVTVALCAGWCARLQRNRSKSLLPAIAVQLVALALLAVVLLPVISLTDDLQACTTLAESEHLSRRGDLQPASDQPVDSLPLSLALLAAAPTATDMPLADFVRVEQSASQQMRGFSRSLATRPPPAA